MWAWEETEPEKEERKWRAENTVSRWTPHIYGFKANRPLSLHVARHLQQSWRQAGIPADTQRPVVGRDYHAILQGPEHARRSINYLFTAIHDIRKLASATDDVRLLHTDMQPRNFVWQAQKNVALVIAPSQPVRLTGDFDTIDATINLHFLYKTEAIGTKEARYFVDGFCESLSQQDRDFAAYINESQWSWAAYLLAAARHPLQIINGEKSDLHVYNRTAHRRIQQRLCKT